VDEFKDKTIKYAHCLDRYKSTLTPRNKSVKQVCCGELYDKGSDTTTTTTT